MRTLFFGSPDLAVPYLEWLAGATELLGAVTNPDEPAGRGYALHITPVKRAALGTKLPVFQPPDLKDPAFLSSLKSLEPDLAVVVAYGKILPPAVLEIPKLGFLNVHFSLLPAYRGAAPVQRALMQGEKLTGVTIFWLDAGMDTGPIFLQKALPIAAEDNADTLLQKLVPLGLEALQEAVQRLAQGDIVRQPQTGPGSKAPPLKKEEGAIPWNRSSDSIVNLIRGLTSWPGAYAFIPRHGEKARLKVLQARALAERPEGPSALPGTVACIEKGIGFVIKCGRGCLLVLQVQPEGKRPMSAWDFWQGSRLKIGEKLVQ